MNLKQTSTLLLISFSCLLSYSQRSISLKGNTPKKHCISKEQREAFFNEIKKNQLKLNSTSQKHLKRNTNHPLFIWPVQETETAKKYHSVWGVSNFVDHDTLADVYNDKGDIIEYHNSDYTGRYRTYDGHRGTDIYITPFWWAMMEEEVAKVVAAAPGKIINKHDGEYDKHCVLDENNIPNTVLLQHEDGSYTWYLHMKKGTVTTKKAGDYVEEGEYLGMVGSSGMSSGPHLHFEVYDKNENLIDPFKGKFNKLNTDSWWKDQKPERLPGIFSITIGTDFINWNDLDSENNRVCGNIEITNEQEVYLINKPIVFTHYFRDPTEESLLKKIKVFRPDNTLAIDWTDINEEVIDEKGTTIKDEFYNDFARTLELITILEPSMVDMEGEWRIEVEFGEDSLVKKFNVDKKLGVDDIVKNDSNTSVYPNPTNDNLFINTNKSIKKIVVTNMLGKVVYKSIDKDTKAIPSVNFSSGMYFITIEDENKNKRTIKFLKN